jgi:hypothetical protein
MDYETDAARHRRMAEEYRMMADTRRDGLRAQFLKLAEAFYELAQSEDKLLRRANIPWARHG